MYSNSRIWKRFHGERGSGRKTKRNEPQGGKGSGVTEISGRARTKESHECGRAGVFSSGRATPSPPPPGNSKTARGRAATYSDWNSGVLTEISVLGCNRPGRGRPSLVACPRPGAAAFCSVCCWRAARPRAAASTTFPSPGSGRPNGRGCSAGSLRLVSDELRKRNKTQMDYRLSCGRVEGRKQNVHGHPMAARRRQNGTRKSSVRP